MRLGNRRALVTGAASGIGAAIARAYAREGARVCVADLDGAGAARMAAELGDGALGIRMDVASEEEVERGVAEAAYGLGGIDILVSNAGVQHLDTIADLSFENWRRVLAVHLDGGFLTARACLRRMIAQGSGGAILLMGSVHSKEASVRKGPYVVAKHGSSDLLECWRRKARRTACAPTRFARASCAPASSIARSPGSRRRWGCPRRRWCEKSC